MTKTHELRNFQHGFDTPAGGIGTTCRLGSKWASAQPGEVLHLYECDVPQGPERFDAAFHDGLQPLPHGVHFRGVGEVLGHWTGPFRKIPEALLALEHEQHCRTREGLAHAMDRAYGAKFGPDETVVMLIYLRHSDGTEATCCQKRTACCAT